MNAGHKMKNRNNYLTHLANLCMYVYIYVCMRVYMCMCMHVHVQNVHTVQVCMCVQVTHFDKEQD